MEDNPKIARSVTARHVSRHISHSHAISSCPSLTTCSVTPDGQLGQPANSTHQLPESRMGTPAVVSRHHPLASDVHVEESPGQRSSSASA